MKHWLGIDPGSNGGMCILYEDNRTEFYDFKKAGIIGYSKEIDNAETVMIGLEKVHSMPQQGVKSVFTFGQRLGELEGMLQTLELGYDLIPPKTWQQGAGVIMPKKATPVLRKKTTYNQMSKLYPKAELLGKLGGIIDGRCDALGIAHYMRIKYS